MRIIALLLALQPCGMQGDAFKTRERASIVYDRLWPLSATAVCNGARHADPEVRRRCREIIERRTARPAWTWDALALWYLFQDGEFRYEDCCRVTPDPLLWEAVKKWGVRFGVAWAEDDGLELRDLLFQYRCRLWGYAEAYGGV